MLFRAVRTGLLHFKSYTVTAISMEFIQSPTRASDLCRSRGIIVALLMEPRTARQTQICVHMFVHLTSMLYNEEKQSNNERRETDENH